MNNLACMGGTITSQVFGISGNIFYSLATIDSGVLSMSSPMPFIKPGNYTSYPTTIDIDLQ